MAALQRRTSRRPRRSRRAPTVGRKSTLAAMPVPRTSPIVISSPRIDPVDAPEDVLALLGREGVARILITNRNHVRKALLVRERSGARVAIHPDDAAYARQQGASIDAELHPGERVGPLTVVGVPGKSPGEVAFHWPERRLLVVGDAVIGNPPGQLSLLRERVMDDPPRLRKSVRALAA